MLRNNIFQRLALLISVFLTTTAHAAETGDTRNSKSISFTGNAEPGKESKDTLFKQSDTVVMPALTEQGFRTESTVMAVQTGTSILHKYSEVSVYDASTLLISDFNYDGFYHRFSVAIDVDTGYEIAYVYAKLFLSYEGGPWNHYATSENYHVYGDSELDSFIIETELADGFPPGYYDLRIEVYDADYDEWLLSYGPYDDVSLSALPLEDSYYDDNSAYSYPAATEIVIAGHGHGSMGWWLPVIPAVLVLCRNMRRRKETNV